MVCLVMHMVDEANRFHIAQVLRTGEGLDTHVLGNCNEEELINSYMQHWVRYFGHPRMLHVDPDGVFNSGWFKQFLSHRHVLIRPFTGEAHRKIGLIERHIQAHKRLIQKISVGRHVSPITVRFSS